MGIKKEQANEKEVSKNKTVKSGEKTFEIIKTKTEKGEKVTLKEVKK